MRSGHDTCCNREDVKIGLWSPEEDRKLINYIKNYGHGPWTVVPTLAGLNRCSKSCRLRWINYLRSDLKRGGFKTHEALLIIELQKIIGNRWAEIVKHLPGRTDNEVKNFWNSSIKNKIVATKEQIAAAAAAARKIANSILKNNNRTIPNRRVNNPTVIIDPPNTQIVHQTVVIPPPPPPPSQPPITILGFDGPIETTYDPQMMMYNPNQPQIPSSDIFVPKIDFDDFPSLPPSPYYSPLSEQNPNDGFFMHGFESFNQMHDNFYYNINPNQIQGYNQDSAMDDATMGEIGPQDFEGVDFGPPFSDDHMMQEDFMGQNFWQVDHPTHIDNIDTHMMSFASPSLYSDDVSFFASDYDVFGPSY